MCAKNKLMLSLLAIFFVQAAAAQQAPTASAGALAGPKPGASAPVAETSSPKGVFIAPTIATLSQLQRAEIDADVKKRLEKLNPPPPPPPVATKPAETAAMVAKRTQATKPPEPVTTKTVLAIYGPQGQEQVEILMPDNSIVKTSVNASRGSATPGFRVTRIVNGSVMVEVLAKQSAPKADKAHKKPHGKGADKAVPVQSTASTVMQMFTVPVGGKFN